MKYPLGDFGYGRKEKPRTSLTVIGLKDRCYICGKRKSSIGVMDRAHIKAASKGGSVVVYLCPNCHNRYDAGKATDRDLKKLGITRSRYSRYIPKKNRKVKKNKVDIDSEFIKLLKPPKSRKSLL
jgi:uncharacterized protein YlaI